MYKIATVIGARPQFVKAAVVSRVMPAQCQEIIIHTGQHYDYELSGSFFKDLEIPEPTYNLGIGSNSHGRQTGDMLASLEEVFIAERPDMVLVYGDTNSTLAGALAAVKLCLPIAHVEAGARNFSLRIPEEVNRIVTDRLSALLFCATQTSILNLEREAIYEGVFFTGDVMLDLHLSMRDRVKADSSLLDKLGVEPGQYLLGTIHRPRNTDIEARLRAIFETFLDINEPIILPLHPRTVKQLKCVDLYERLVAAPHVRLIAPLGYLEFLRLELEARLILTDSGGVQREAYFCQRPCVTLFHNTAWPETVEDGWNTLVDADRERLLNAICTFQPTQAQRDVFGNGKAGEKIIAYMLDYFEHPRPIYI